MYNRILMMISMMTITRIRMITKMYKNTVIHYIVTTKYILPFVPSIKIRIKFFVFRYKV